MQDIIEDKSMIRKGQNQHLNHSWVENRLPSLPFEEWGGLKENKDNIYMTITHYVLPISSKQHEYLKTTQVDKWVHQVSLWA